MKLQTQVLWKWIYPIWSSNFKYLNLLSHFVKLSLTFSFRFTSWLSQIQNVFYFVNTAKLYYLIMIIQKRLKIQLSRCASCVARCIPPCNLCAYFRNPQGQTISSWILVYICVCPTISTALKEFGPKKN